MGPFKATSGVVLPYYLNLSTNFLDREIAGDIIEILSLYMDRIFKKTIGDHCYEKENVLCVGMEVAGGMMACQLASEKSSPLFKWMDFVYMRKDKKTSGTCQQLEGPSKFTKRTKDSPVLYGIWLDDCLSTGGSMLRGIKTLKEDYNIEIVGSFFLVDRSKDRQKLPDERQALANDEFKDLKLGAVYDLQEIDDLIKY